MQGAEEPGSFDRMSHRAHDGTTQERGRKKGSQSLASDE